MTFKEVGNLPLLWILVSAVLLYVVGLTIIFLVKSYKRCKELGIDKETVRRVIISSATFSIIPSIAIIIGVISLSTVLGTPWAWFRLSVVGSVVYELMAADMVGKAMGFENLTAMANTAGSNMGAVMIVMSVGIIGALVICVLFTKKIQTSMVSVNEKAGGWGALFTSCFMMAMLTVFLPMQIVAGTIAILTLLTSLMITAVLGLIMNKTGAAWMGNYILSTALVLGMASSVMWTNILG